MQKFMTRDLIKLLRTIVETRMEYCQSGLDYDIEDLTKAAENAASITQENRTFLWMMCKCGTWCLQERNVFIRDSWEHKVWTFYKGHTNKENLAYRIEVYGMEGRKVTGSVCELNFQKHCRFVSDMAACAAKIQFSYEKGERVQPADQPFPQGRDPKLGNIVSYQYIPRDARAFDDLLDMAADSSRWGSSNWKEKWMVTQALAS